MQEPSTVPQIPAIDPEEETERQLVHVMALAIVAVVGAGVLFLALRPWLKKLREDGAGAPAALRGRRDRRE